MEGCIGLKTGYPQAAGRTLVSCAERNGQRLVAVTLQDSEGTVYECEYPQELRLPEGTQFEAGKSYNVRMTINGPKAVTLSAKLTQWDSDTEDLEGIVF